MAGRYSSYCYIRNNFRLVLEAMKIQAIRMARKNIRNAKAKFNVPWNFLVWLLCKNKRANFSQLLVETNYIVPNNVLTAIVAFEVISVRCATLFTSLETSLDVLHFKNWNMSEIDKQNLSLQVFKKKNVRKVSSAQFTK